ncbi:MAG: hypothetical protein D8M58_06625 [Calditrichaeota bacterium]|nr:MAG: hypothetical protein DWQ03_19875 [Calditrichota bacterium]MBL1205052.1 hypothetical protein [Calditrichota bacterium]NOG44882.1 hypothetical protein [Calditrichota bacterium]
MHFIFGIAWIGASFYFVFLENALNRSDLENRDELAGHLWAIHGGGIYYLEKFKNAPQKMPRHLHWFKYEAYFTWITGIGLLFIVYYFNAQSYLIDTQKADIGTLMAVSIGIGSMIISWFFYDLISRTSLLKKRTAFFWVMFFFMVIVAFILSQVFTGRGAFIHVGAIIGTLAVGNVFQVIIPSQKALVKAAEEGKEQDPSLGLHAQQRSYHNNYFTFPLLFIMISSHFPATFGSSFNWIILAILSLASNGIKHFFNLLDRGERNYIYVGLALVTIIGLIIFTAPKQVVSESQDAEQVSFEEINTIFKIRCITCHSENPTDKIFVAAPNGVKFDKAEEIVKMKDRILNRVVQTKTMPLANQSNMTDEERKKIEIWIAQGAKVE